VTAIRSGDAQNFRTAKEREVSDLNFGDVNQHPLEWKDLST
jgi:hypothetical protein